MILVLTGLFVPKINLPSSRTVSNTMIGTSPRPSSRFTTLLMAMGQYIDHDLDHTPVTEGVSGNGIDCCNGNFFKDDLSAEEALVCFPIRIPRNDPVFKNQKTCLNFVRSVGSIQLDCQPGPYQQVNSKYLPLKTKTKIELKKVEENCIMKLITYF